MKSRRMKLRGMLDEGRCRPWIIDWQAFGPIPNSVAPLREDPGIDGLKEIPSQLRVDGRDYRPVMCRSTDGHLDFRSMFGSCSGIPIVFLFARVPSPGRRKTRVFFGADWFTRWWVNGVLVGDTATDNVVAADDIHFHRLEVTLERGDNLVMVKVGGGSGGWNLSMGIGPRLAGETGGRWCSIPRGTRCLGSPTRDYLTSGLRIEYRNGSDVPGLQRWKEEPLMRAAGVQARWIQVVDNRGSPLYPSRCLAPAAGADLSAKKRLQAWIRAIRNQGMPALSWYPMCYSHEAVRAHPTWVSLPLPGGPRKHGEATAHGCINTPYGEALIAFAVEAIGELGLDGFWFDGSHFAPGHLVVCACEYCRRKFTSETGLGFPSKEDWSDASFRHWVKWRYRTFTEYWGRLAGGIRRAHPHARVAINHLHRPDGGTSCWLMGAPLSPTGVDTIGGTESSSLWRTSAFITRLTRAYGYDEVENWMGFHLLHTVLKGDPTVYLHHALDCMTAGGMP